MAKYIFISKSDALDEDKSVLSHTNYAVTGDEVVRCFYYFLLGCSFHKNTVISGMRELVEEFDTEEERQE